MSVVYFVQRASGGLIKIGCSAYLERRIAQIATDLKAELRILAAAPGNFRDEGRLHRQFAGIRREGEWFEATAELLAAVDHITRTGKLPPPLEEDREIVMAARYLGGETLQQIAADFDMTRERVRQILRRAGVPSLGMRERHRRTAAPVTDFEREVAGVYSEGKTSPTDICAAYDLNVSQLYTILRRTDTRRLPKGHFTKRADNDALVAGCADLYNQGVKTREIAQRLGLPCQEHVYVYLRRAGVAPTRLRGRRGAVEAKSEQIIAAYLGGKTAKEVAADLGSSPQAVSNLLKRHGVQLPPEEVSRRRMLRVHEGCRKSRWTGAAA